MARGRTASKSSTYSQLAGFAAAVILFHTTLVACSSAAVTNERQLESALADATVDHIIITSPFFINRTGVSIIRSIAVVGHCHPEPACVLTIGADGVGPALQIDPAAAGGAVVQIEGIKLQAQPGGTTGGAVACVGSVPTSLYLTSVVFDGFKSNDGALRIVGESCMVTCIGCGFTGNAAAHQGGAVHVVSGSFACYGCDFKDNSAKSGGAIHVQGGRSVLFYPTFSGNCCEDAGPDVSIDAPGAGSSGSPPAFSYCPALPAPDATGSAQGPGSVLLCADLGNELQGLPPIPRQGVTSSGSSQASGALPPAAPPSLPSQRLLGKASPPAAPKRAAMLSRDALSPYLVMTLSPITSAGGEHVHVDQRFSLRATLDVIGKLAANLDLTIHLNPGQSAANDSSPGGSCGGFQLQRVDASHGFCSFPGNESCSLVCHLDGVQTGARVLLDITMVALVAGAQLNLSSTAVVNEGSMVSVPVQMAAFPGLEVRAVEVLHAAIVPRTGKGSYVASAIDGEQVLFFVGTAPMLPFIVVGSTAITCNLTQAVLLDGDGHVENVVVAARGGVTFSFNVVAAANSVLQLRVPPDTCVYADGSSSPESDPFVMLVDFTRPLVTVASISGPRTQQDFASFTVQFSERVFDLSEEGFTVENGAIMCLMAVNAATGTYAVTVAPTHNAVCSVTVKEGAARDVGLNPSVVSNTAFVEHYVSNSALATVTAAWLGTTIAIGAVTVLVTRGAAMGLLASFIGHMQFFQMMGSLDVPLDVTLREALHGAAWVNNGWPWVLLAGRDPRSIKGPSEAPLWNGSCQHHVGEFMADAGAGGLGMGVGVTYADLLRFADENYPNPVPSTRDGRDELAYLYSLADTGNVVIISLCELAAVLAARLLALLVRGAVDRCHPVGSLELSLLHFPRLELLIMMLTFPGMAQAGAFAMSAGFKLGALLGASVLALHPLAFFVFSAHFIIADVLWKKECIFLAEALPSDGGSLPPTPQRAGSPGAKVVGGIRAAGSFFCQALARGAPSHFACQGSWTDLGATVRRDYVLQYGLLFEDLKGPVAMDADSGNFGLLESITSSAHYEARRTRGRAAARYGAVQEASRSSDSLSETGTPSSVQSSNLSPRWLLDKSSALWQGRRAVTSGHLRASYMLVRLFKQLSFAVVVGLSPRQLPNLGWYQVCLFVPWLMFHVIYVLALQPFSRSAASRLELLATGGQLASMMCALLLLVTGAGKGTSTRAACSYVMLALMALSAAAFLAIMVLDLLAQIPKASSRARLGSYLKGSSFSMAIPRLASFQLHRHLTTRSASACAPPRPLSSEHSDSSSPSSARSSDVAAYSPPPPGKRLSRRNSWPPRTATRRSENLLLYPPSAAVPVTSFLGRRDARHDGQWPVRPVEASEKHRGAGSQGPWHAVDPAHQPRRKVWGGRPTNHAQGGGLRSPSSTRLSQWPLVDAQSSRYKGKGMVLSVPIEQGPSQPPAGPMLTSAGDPSGMRHADASSAARRSSEGEGDSGGGTAAGRKQRSLFTQHHTYYDRAPLPGARRPARRKSRLSPENPLPLAGDASASDEYLQRPSPASSTTAMPSPVSLSSALRGPPSRSFCVERPLHADLATAPRRRASLADSPSPFMSRVLAFYGRGKDAVVHLDGSRQREDATSQTSQEESQTRGARSATYDGGDACGPNRWSEPAPPFALPNFASGERGPGVQWSARRATLPPPSPITDLRRASLPGSYVQHGPSAMECLELPRRDLLSPCASPASRHWHGGSEEETSSAEADSDAMRGHGQRVTSPFVVVEAERARVELGYMALQGGSSRWQSSSSEMGVHGFSSSSSKPSLVAQDSRRSSLNSSADSLGNGPESLLEDAGDPHDYPGVPLRSAAALNAGSPPMA